MLLSSMWIFMETPISNTSEMVTLVLNNHIMKFVQYHKLILGKRHG